MVAYSQIKKAAGSNVPMPATNTVVNPSVPKSSIVNTVKGVAASPTTQTLGVVPKSSTTSTNKLIPSNPVAAAQNKVTGAIPKIASPGISIGSNLPKMRGYTPQAAQKPTGVVPTSLSTSNSNQTGVIPTGTLTGNSNAVPSSNVLDWNSAMSQAYAQYNPIYEQSAAAAQSQGWQNNLDAGEMASARGGSQSGLAADLQNKVNMNTSNAIKDLAAQRDAQVAAMATNLVNQSQQNAFQEAQLTGYYNGKRTESGNLNDWNKTYQEAGLTGTYNGQKTSDQAYNDKMLAINEGQVTGTYLSPELSAAYDTVLAAKQEYAAATTQQARQAAMNKANAARATITKLGGNADLVGANVSYDQATGNSSKFGIQTQASKEFDQTMAYNKDRAAAEDEKWQKEFNLNTTQVMAALTGFLPDGTKTTAQQQQELSNLWAIADATGTIPDKLAEKYGLPKGTQTLQAKQYALQEWQAQDSSALAWDDNAMQWVKTDLSTQPQAAEYSGMTANQVYDAAATMFKDKDGKIPTDTATKEAIYKQVGSAGLPAGQDDQIMVLLGLSQEDIATFDKKYGVSSGK